MAASNSFKPSPLRGSPGVICAISLVIDPQFESFFKAHQAHSDVGLLFLDSLEKLGDYEVRGNLRGFAAPMS